VQRARPLWTGPWRSRTGTCQRVFGPRAGLLRALRTRSLARLAILAAYPGLCRSSPPVRSVAAISPALASYLFRYYAVEKGAPPAGTGLHFAGAAWEKCIHGSALAWLLLARPDSCINSLISRGPERPILVRHNIEQRRYERAEPANSEQAGTDCQWNSRPRVYIFNIWSHPSLPPVLLDVTSLGDARANTRSNSLARASRFFLTAVVTRCGRSKLTVEGLASRRQP
jgi:hypothetical protein